MRQTTILSSVEERTATHPAVDYNGKSETVIDIAAFPGSSGSPVLIVNEGSYATKHGLTVGIRGHLLGILHAGPKITNTGEIKIVDVPTVQQPIAVTSTMMHLGYIIKAREIIRLCEHMEQEFRKLGKFQ